MILEEDPPVDLGTPSGPMRTYVYRPVAPGRYPGLLLFSEIFQRTGSYKIRGPLNKLTKLTDDERKRGVVCSSAGNHAQGLALAAQIYGIPAVVVMAPPIDGPAGSILALLAGGESWSTSALAYTLGSSQRTLQRALRQLEEAAAVRAVGHGRSRRWLAPALGGFATTLLLPGALAVG